MTRNLKVIGLAITAILALSAFMAATASANYTSQSKTTVLAGTSTDHIFHTDVGTVTCHAEFESHSESAGSTAPFTVSSLTVKANYTGCEAFGVPAEVKMNGCDYVFNNPAEFKATTEIKCAKAGEAIEIKVFFCTMTVGPQKPGGTVNFANEGSGTTAQVKGTNNLTGIVYGGNCGSGTNGTYTGTTVMKGYTSTAKTTRTGVSVM